MIKYVLQKNGRLVFFSAGLILILCLLVASREEISLSTAEGFAQSNPLFCANGSTFTSSQTFPIVLGETNGINLGWFVKFTPIPDQFSNGAESVAIIRFKPKFDNNGNRTGDYLLAISDRDDDGSDNGIPNEYPRMPELNDDEMGFLVDTNPGGLWVVGNEVDREEVQDSLYPATYAKAYHDVYNFIKERDATAQVAFSALVQVTPGRLQYLDLVLEAYRSMYRRDMPVDVWTFHVYPIPEVDYFDTNRNSSASVALGTDRLLAKTNAVISVNGATDNTLCQSDNVICISEHDDFDLFQEQVLAMRTWMAENGYKEKPLILTEWSILWPDNFFDEFGQTFSDARVATYLDRTLAYLETASDPNIGYAIDQNRLVQRWAWFSVNTPSNTTAGSSNLIENGVLTAVGQAYRDRIQQQPDPFIDLVVDDVFNGGGAILAGETTTSIKVGVQVRNAGNVRTSSAYTVEVIDSTTNQVVGSGVIPSGLQGCTTAVAQVHIDWLNVAPGLREFTVSIPNSFDPTPANNVGFGEIFVGTEQIYLPFATYK